MTTLFTKFAALGHKPMDHTDKPRAHSTRRDTLMAVALASASFCMVLSYLWKQRCTGGGFDATGRSENFTSQTMETDACYSDIQFLWSVRGFFNHDFPYINGSISGRNLLNGALEYPVLTGIFTWLSGLPASNDAEFLFYSALFLFPFGLITTAAFVHLSGQRSLIWAATPPLIFYAFLNWDLLVTATFAVAVLCWSRRWYAAAAIMLGVGAALKLYPAFFLIPLALDRYTASGDERREKVKSALKVLAVGGGTFALINLPFIIANRAGWWATYAFQKVREADFTTNSIWYWAFPRFDTSLLNKLVPLLLLASWMIALGYGWIRANHEGRYPWLQVSGAMLCSFLLFNKVHSPQYILWLLPFFVLLNVRVRWWLTYLVCDVLLFFGLWGWARTTEYFDNDILRARQTAILGVWGRAVMLCVLFVVFLVSTSAMRAQSNPQQKQAAENKEANQFAEA